MIIGIGIDLVQIPAFKDQLSDPASSFLDTVFTKEERVYCENAISREPARHFAARYAAKEAAVKALDAACASAGLNPPLLNLGTIEVIRDDAGRPALQFHDDAKRLVEAAGADRAHLSISHEHDYANAMVVLERISQI